jgi:ankyrin repeat protein
MEEPGLKRMRLVHAFALAAMLTGALVACQGKSPDEALILAVRGNDVAKVEALLAEGADPNADKVPRYEGRPPLFHAATFGYVDVARALIDKGAKVDYADPSGLTPLMVAALNGPPSMVELLLSTGASVDVSAGGATPLTEAVRKGDPVVLRLLLEAGAEPNAPMSDGSAPLCYAQSHNFGDAAEVIRQAGGQGEC